MRERIEMSLAFQKDLTPAAITPEFSAAQRSDSRIEISVVFTSVASTIAALKHAAALADELGARINLLIPQIVPYPLPLTSPPVLIAFNERRFRLIAAESPVETSVSVYLCRDALETVAAALKRHSIVVLGGRRRWWPWLTREQRLAAKLCKAGHEVVFTESE